VDHLFLIFLFGGLFAALQFVSGPFEIQRELAAFPGKYVHPVVYPLPVLFEEAFILMGPSQFFQFVLFHSQLIHFSIDFF